MSGARALALIATVILLCEVTPAAAQVWIRGGSGPVAGSVEFTGGLIYAQGYDLGSSTASLTRNPTTGSSPFDLFDARAKIDPTPGVHAKLGYYLTPTVSIEGGVQYSRPVLGISLTGDAEGADAITATETITRYVFDGSLVVHLLQMSFAGGRGVPFVTGGGGYVRELHEGNELAETGRQYHAGAGVKLWFGNRRRVGFRGEVGVALREDASDFNDGRRTVPTLGASLVYLF